MWSMQTKSWGTWGAVGEINKWGDMRCRRGNPVVGVYGMEEG